MRVGGIGADLTDLVARPRSIRARLFYAGHPAASQGDIAPLLYFLAARLIALLYLLWLQPLWTSDGEMHTEMATNYFRYAQSSDLMTKLFALTPATSRCRSGADRGTE